MTTGPGTDTPAAPRYRSMEWEDVFVGQDVGRFSYGLSLIRMVAMVRATGLYDYVHFDRDYARGAGAKDAFASTPHLSGLLSRLVTDWAGPDADLRSLSMRIGSPCYCDDELVVSGSVVAVDHSDEGGHVAEIGLNISNGSAASAVTGKAKVALPSRTAGPVGRQAAPAPLADVECAADAPDFAKAAIGKVKVGRPEPATPLTRQEIHLWCEAIEDWNPLYWDEDFAVRGRHGGLVAPPAGVFYGAGSSANLGIGCNKPGARIPPALQTGLTGLPLLRRLREDMISENAAISPPGFSEVAVVDMFDQYFNALKPGDTTRVDIVVNRCSTLKKTRLGEGYFIDWERRIFKQTGDIVRNCYRRTFNYRV